MFCKNGFFFAKHLFIFSMVLNEFSSTGISCVLSEIKKLNPGNKILIIESEKTAWKIRENRQTQLFTKEEESTGVIDLRDSRPLQEINGHFLQRRFRYVAFKFNFGGTIWNF
jgi:hypothetical protein